MHSNFLRSLRSFVPALLLVLLPVISHAQVSLGVSISVAPPPLPVYVQPPIPAPGYIWTPGYWAWGPYGYYWVPGTWVEPPSVGLLWTPGYWAWSDGLFIWHAGYWGPRVGFYGGVDYGFGYPGSGYYGGYWRGHTFFYNRAVANVTSVHITNVYTSTVVNNVSVNHVSFNGGPGGIAARPSHAEELIAREHHVELTPVQRQHVQLAAANPQLRVATNHGRPAIAATARPTMFSGHGVIAAHAAGGPVHEEQRSAVQMNAEHAHRAAAQEAARHEPAQHAAAQREMAQREATQREMAQHEAAQRQAAQREPGHNGFASEHGSAPRPEYEHREPGAEVRAHESRQAVTPHPAPEARQGGRGPQERGHEHDR